MIPRLNDRIRIPSIDHVGTVTYIDHAHLFDDTAFPIQVELDTPLSRCQYDAAWVWRTNLKDIEIIAMEAK
jgi:hypothetical protein